MNCLNCAAFLAPALDSVNAQTFQDFEIIFWDNGSTDGSGAIAKNFGPRLRYFHSSRTVPLGAARNLAIAEARGRYIAFLDCDDLWRPAKLEKQVELFEQNPEAGLVCTDTEIFDGKRTLSFMFAAAAPARGHAFRELMTRQWISMSSAMLRKTALDGLLKPECGGQWFDESLNVCEEADVFYRIAHDWQIDYIAEPLTIWRVNGLNTTFKKFGQFALETGKILEKHRRLYPGYDQDYKDIVSLLEQRMAFQKAVALWKLGQGAEARKILKPYKGLSAKHRLFWAASFLPGSLFDPLARLYFALPQKLRR